MEKNDELMSVSYTNHKSYNTIQNSGFFPNIRVADEILNTNHKNTFQFCLKSDIGIPKILKYYPFKHSFFDVILAQQLGREI